MKIKLETFQDLETYLADNRLGITRCKRLESGGPNHGKWEVSICDMMSYKPHGTIYWHGRGDNLLGALKSAINHFEMSRL